MDCKFLHERTGQIDGATDLRRSSKVYSCKETVKMNTSSY